MTHELARRVSSCVLVIEAVLHVRLLKGHMHKHTNTYTQTYTEAGGRYRVRSRENLDHDQTSTRTSHVTHDRLSDTSNKLREDGRRLHTPAQNSTSDRNLCRSAQQRDGIPYAKAQLHEQKKAALPPTRFRQRTVFSRDAARRDSRNRHPLFPKIKPKLIPRPRRWTRKGLAALVKIVPCTVCEVKQMCVRERTHREG